MTHAEALAELDSIRLGYEEAQQLWSRSYSLPSGTIGRSTGMEDAVSDAIAYAEREAYLRKIIEEECFKTS